MRWGPVEHRAKIARYAASDETGAEVDVYLDAKFSVSFGQRTPEGIPRLAVPQVLGDIHRRIVRKVFPPLHPYLVRMPVVKVSQSYCLLRDKGVSD